jgi:hypothetical protein
MSASRRCRLPDSNRRESAPEGRVCLQQAPALASSNNQDVLEQVEVHSDLNSTTPVSTAELEVIEMYLSALLAELFD